MNALQRDLKRLVTLAERQGEAGRAEDPTRLRFHLMPPVGWMNDPNGLCWYQENYHVFFQYGPFDPNGGVKFWGHWTSPDLLHWTQQPVFLCPDQPWDIHGVYSGSALVEEDELYLYYTGNVKYPGDYDYIYDGRGHNLALATTRDGIHPDSKRLLLENRDYPPEVSCHVRDPKVWKQDGKYYMVLGARTRQDQGELLIYESEDRLHWALCNTITTPQPFGYMWECPDIFCVDGQWIVMTSPQGLERQGNRYYVPDLAQGNLYPYNTPGQGVDTDACGVYLAGKEGAARRTWLSRQTVLTAVVAPDSMEGSSLVLEARLEDGAFQQYQTFALELVRVPTLSGLRVTGDGTRLPLAFDPAVTDYGVTTVSDTLTVEPTALCQGVRVTVNGKTGAAVEVPVSGDTEITVEASHENGCKRAYTIRVTKAASTDVTVTFEPGVSL